MIRTFVAAVATCGALASAELSLGETREAFMTCAQLAEAGAPFCQSPHHRCVDSLSVGANCIRNSFPVQELRVDQGQVDRLNSTTPERRDDAAYEILVPQLREWMNTAQIEVSPEDTSFTMPIPNEVHDGSCSSRVETLNTIVSASVLDSSYFKYTGDIEWGQDWHVVGEAKLDAGLRINTDARVSTGVRVLGKCQRIARKTVGVDVTSTGENGIAIDFGVENTRLELSPTVPFGLDLVFNLNVKLLNLVIDWNVENVDISRCDITILGIKIGSICSFLRRLVRDGIEGVINDTQEVVAPELMAKVEAALGALDGEEIRIPLQL